LNGNFAEAVYVDLIRGGVYEILAGQWSRNGTMYKFKKIAFYDDPVLITDSSPIQIRF
jgi:hypothetical protein